MKLDKNLIYYIKKHKILFSLVVLFGILVKILGVIVPLFVGNIIDLIIYNLSNGDVGKTRLSFNVLILVLIGFVMYISRNLHIIAYHYFGEKIGLDIKSDVFEALQDQSQKYFDNQSIGDLISKSTSDVGVVASAHFVIGNFIINSIHILFILGVLYSLDPIIFLISLGIVLFSTIITKRFEGKYSPLYTEFISIRGKMNKVLQETIDGSVVVQTLNGKNLEISKFDNQNKKLRNLGYKIAKINSAFFLRTNILTPLSIAIIILVGGYQVVDGYLTTGLLISSILLIRIISGPIGQLTSAFMLWTRAKIAGERVFSIVNSERAITNNIMPIEFPKDALGFISFKNVTFSYQNEPVLDEITLNIPSGSNIAILGSTGCGKSSLINLIPRFYDPTSGKVTIDGIDIKEYNIESLRSRIGFVDQETFLFSKTIHENIAFGKPDASREEVIKAAKYANANDFINSMLETYDTIIGKRGNTLSGGQRQRISIARALLINPRIVIFDDSLSAVDMKTEKQIQDATYQLLQGRTTIFITQRISTIKNADQIIILKDGRIFEQGTHEELMKNDSAYKQMFLAQIEGLLDLSILNVQGDYIYEK